MPPSPLRRLDRNQWALVAALVAVLGLTLLALAKDVNWTWPAVAVLALVGVKAFLSISKSDDQAAQNLGRKLRAKRDPRKREASKSP